MKTALKRLIKMFMIDSEMLKEMLEFSDLEHLNERNEKFRERYENLLDSFIESIITLMDTKGQKNPYLKLVESKVFVDPFSLNNKTTNGNS